MDINKGGLQNESDDLLGFDRLDLISLILDHRIDIISASVADDEKRIALSMRGLNFVFSIIHCCILVVKFINIFMFLHCLLFLNIALD